MTKCEKTVRAGSQRATGINLSAFTLVELLAVVLVIVMLVAIVVGTAGYAGRRAHYSTTKAQLATIETALDSYKGDFGYYPPTMPARISSSGGVESTNNFFLYNALYGSGRHYLTFPQAQVHKHPVTPRTNIFDIWDRPFNYYCSPTNPLSVYNPPDPNSGYTVGGQVRMPYDLFSYGPDHVTYVPGAIGLSIYQSWYVNNWGTYTAANDDVTSRP